MVMDRKTKTVLMFVPLALLAAGLAVAVNDVKHPETDTDTCMVMAVGSAASAMRTPENTIYARSSKPEHDIAFKCDKRGSVVINDGDIIVTSIQAGNGAVLTHKAFKILPDRWHVDITTPAEEKKDEEQAAPEEAVSGAAKPAVLMLPGNQYANANFKAADGERWTGLFCKENKCFLKTTAIKLGMQEETQTPVVEVPGLPEPLFLVRDMPQLKDGDVVSVDNLNVSERVVPGYRADFEMGDWYYQLALFGDAQEVSYPNALSDTVLKKLRFKLASYPKDNAQRVGNWIASQELGPFKDDIVNQFRVMWAGDLDRDGRLDFLLITSCYGGESSLYDLYLSTADGKKLVGIAASSEYSI